MQIFSLRYFRMYLERTEKRAPAKQISICTMAQITRYLVKFVNKQINQSDGSNMKIEPSDWLIRWFTNFTRYQVIWALV